MSSSSSTDKLTEFLAAFYQLEGPTPAELGPYAEKIISFGDLFSHSPVAIFMTDYFNQGFRYVSPNVQQLGGYSADDFLREGLSILFRIQHPEDSRTFINEVSPAIIQQLSQLSPQQIQEVQIRFNYRVKRKDGKYIHVVQQTIMLEVSEYGQPILDMAQVSIGGEASGDAPPLIRLEIMSPNNRGIYQPIHAATYPNQHESNNLTPRQTEILELIAKGRDSRDIADSLHISYHTVNTHRRHMLKKMQVQSMPELVNLATVLGWI